MNVRSWGAAGAALVLSLSSFASANLLATPAQALTDVSEGFTGTGAENCYWYHPLWLGFGCSQPDLSMMIMKKQAEIYAAEGDRYEYWAMIIKMQEMEREYDQMYEGTLNPLHVKAMTPLSSNSVIDIKMVGSNVRYATVPGPWGQPNKRLLVYDKLGRPFKLSGAFCTSEVAFWRNVGLTFLTEWITGERVLGSAIKIASAGKVILAEGVVGTTWAAVTTIATAKSAMVPGSGDCIMLVDILDHPRWDGTQHVYRNQVRIDRLGNIDAREWSDWKYADDGIGFWKDLGAVGYDEEGNPVW